MAGKLEALAVAGLIVFLGITVAGSAEQPDPFERACYWTEMVTDVNCDGVDAPQVFEMPGRFIDRFLGRGTRGFFIPGDTTVYVRKELSAAERYAVQVHEMTHYILDVKARTTYRRCASEEAARRVTDLELGRAYTSDWKSWYKCDPRKHI